MSRIAAIDDQHAPAAVQATFSAVKAKLGMVPNLVRTFAQSPAALNGYLGLSEALSKGALKPRQREIVALTVAQANGCQYCLSAHTLLGKGAGLTPDAIQAARQGHGVDPTDDAVAVFARRVVETRGRVSDADLAVARSAGLDDGRIVEVIAQVAMNVLTNFTNNVADTDIDFPKVDLTLNAAA
jgi:uncharacterized peroxidase-related enzyme